LLQLRAEDGTRQVVARAGDAWRIVGRHDSIRELALAAIAAKRSLTDEVTANGLLGPVKVEAELAAGRVLAPIDHPDPAHLWLTGTGLTHLGSAEGRDRMHKAAVSGENLTDSMRMFLEGMEEGKPAERVIGQQPEWFYKGNGDHLIGPEGTLSRPVYARDGGEEPELAGIYLIGPDGTPFRLGFCLANEFSDHVTERHNYLWLAHSKLREASLGPELLAGELPPDIRGASRIRRRGAIAWEKPFLTGESNMSHTIANLEHHHFKYSLFRHPGDVHVHFFGTATASFADGFETQAGDIFEIEAAPFTLALRNTLIFDSGAATPTTVTPL
jgi:hypothetical protein